MESPYRGHRFPREIISHAIWLYHYYSEGYGIVGSREREAIPLVAKYEGILLDPVYSGRAMGALIDMSERREFTSRDTVLFWHTGGIPAIFAYGRELCA